MCLLAICTSLFENCLLISFAHLLIALFDLLFLVVLGFELRAYTLSHSTNLFCVRYFGDKVLQTYLL
jgi:hypothetical protein